jgi:hypothetical protein
MGIFSDKKEIVVTPEECNTIYQQLETILRRMTMTWVIDQVNEVVALGKPQMKKVRTMRVASSADGRLLPRESLESRIVEEYVGDVVSLVPHKVTRRGPGPEAELTTVQAYTPQERVGLLIDAIEQTFVERPAMESSVLQTLNDLATTMDQDSGMVFVSEQDNQQRQEVSYQESVMRNANAQHLRTLLHELKGHINDK